MKSTYLILCLSLMLTGCNYEITDNDEGPDRNFVENVEKGTDLGFAFIKTEVFHTSCNRCHTGESRAGDLNLETYEEVFEKRQGIYKAVSTFYMPESKNRTMTDERRALLLEWIEAGAPENPTAPAQALVF